MWLSAVIMSWTVVVWPGQASGEMYSWADDKGITHFSDTPPADRQAKRLKIPEDCPLRGQIVELPLGARANLGLWLYLGAPLQTDNTKTEQYSSRRRSRDYWERQRESQDHQMRDIKNKIIFEARQCAVGVKQACACSRSLFHDPPRGFAPDGYVPTSETKAKDLGGQLAERDMSRP
jgi:hypothetical protein